MPSLALWHSHLSIFCPYTQAEEIHPRYSKSNYVYLAKVWGTAIFLHFNFFFHFFVFECKTNFWSLISYYNFFSLSFFLPKCYKDLGQRSNALRCCETALSILPVTKEVGLKVVCSSSDEEVVWKMFPHYLSMSEDVICLLQLLLISFKTQKRNSW